jgi:hypothetical protein
MGLCSHGIATARAFQENEIAGTFAGLAMALNGIATAALVPLIIKAARPRWLNIGVDPWKIVPYAELVAGALALATSYVFDKRHLAEWRLPR